MKRGNPKNFRYPLRRYLHVTYFAKPCAHVWNPQNFQTQLATYLYRSASCFETSYAPRPRFIQVFFTDNTSKHQRYEENLISGIKGGNLSLSFTVKFAFRGCEGISVARMICQFLWSEAKEKKKKKKRIERIELTWCIAGEYITCLRYTYVPGCLTDFPRWKEGKPFPRESAPTYRRLYERTSPKSLYLLSPEISYLARIFLPIYLYFFSFAFSLRLPPLPLLPHLPRLQIRRARSRRRI